MSGPLRYIIDSLVLIMAAVWLLPLLFAFFTPYVDEITPDETLALDERVLEVAEEYPANFDELLSDPGPVGALSLTYGAATDPVLSGEAIYTQSIPSIVYIYTITAFGDYSGTGAVVDSDGVIMTNYHNVDGADQVLVVTHEGDIYPVTKVLAFDDVLDVAYLQIPASRLTPIALGNIDEIAIGEETFVIGHPEGFMNTISDGVISGMRQYTSRATGRQLQITNPISSGNSGGVVLNRKGHVLGIPTAAVEYTDNSVQVQNINLAVPIDAALSVLDMQGM